MAKQIEIKIQNGFRNANISERKQNITCGYCIYAAEKDFKTVGKQLRCKLIGEGENRRYIITHKSTCDKYVSQTINGIENIQKTTK